MLPAFARFAAALVCVLLVLPLTAARSAPSAVTAEVLTVDLNKRIDESARHPDLFAVDVPHSADVTTQGEWTRTDGESVWRYAVRVPTAVTMSFHGVRVALPASATLTVSGGGVTYTLGPRDVRAGDVWSRIVRGDTLQIELHVAAIEEGRVAFQLASVQAGYRGLGGGVADHPHFKAMRAQTAAATSTCIENFACHETAANTGPGAATAAIVVGNIALCTATLINNVRGDGTPYLLTARHCQNGEGGGGHPEAAASVAVYWDATVPCAFPLGMFYNTATPVRVGGTTVIEQQDLWLIKLYQQPNGQRVYFAGWDSTGGSWTGGFSPQHALGRSRQYTGWFGQSILDDISGSALGVGFDSTYWGVNNEIGSVGSGASGGGLFDSNTRLVGTASLAHLIDSNGDSDGVCPTNPPQAPTPANVVAYYNALSAIWDSTADATSSTNPNTLRSVLDPDGTGQRVVDGFEALGSATLWVDWTTWQAGDSDVLRWNAQAATSCTATGGRPGDGWTGTLPPSGSKEVTEYDAGRVTYGIRCTDGTRIAVAQAQIEWSLAAPRIFLGADPSGFEYLGTNEHLVWFSNVIPCTASGGIPGDGWAGPKSPRGPQDVPISRLGTITYHLSCGSGSRSVSTDFSYDVRPPFAFVDSAVDNMRIGELLYVQWNGAPACVASGGAPGDGWAGPLTGMYGYKQVTETSAGAFTYTVTCSGGGITQNASITRHFTAGPPTATLVAHPTTAEISPPNSAVVPVTLDWSANVQPCALSLVGPGYPNGYVARSGLVGSGSLPEGEYIAGTYTYTLACGSGPTATQATAVVQFTTSHPAVSLSATPTIVANAPAYVSWNSNVMPCTASGGASGDGWAGPKTNANGVQQIVESAAGHFTFVIDCGTGAYAVHASATGTVPAPAVTLTTNVTDLQVYQDAYLHWDATTSPCAATSDSANPRWDGSVNPSDSRSVSETVPGTYTYTVTCGVATAVVQASVTITFDPRPTPTATITATPDVVGVNEPVTLTWSTANTGLCLAQGSGYGGDWAGVLASSGSAVVTKSAPGTYTYQISCGNADAQVSVEYRSVSGGGNPFPPPTVNLTTSATTQTVGLSIALTWGSTAATSCVGSGGAAGDGWSGSLSLAGTQSVTESAAGAYTYNITCEGAPPAATMSVSASFTAASSSGGGGGGGGGGAIDAALLSLLASLTAWRWRRGDRPPPVT